MISAGLNWGTISKSLPVSPTRSETAASFLAPGEARQGTGARQRRRGLVLGYVLALVVGTAQAAPEAALALDEIDEPVPVIRLNTADGSDALGNAELRGQISIVHFWATWCAPCKRELPALIALASRLPPAGFRLVLVSVDEDASAEDVEDFARELDYTGPVYLAHASVLPASFWQWGVPVTYFILDGKRFIGRALGARSWETLAPAVLALATP